MKTLKNWTEANVLFDNYFSPFDEVDKDLIDFIGESSLGNWINDDYYQVGDCIKEENGIKFFDTFVEQNGAFYYLGQLPKFKR